MIYSYQYFAIFKKSQNPNKLTQLFALSTSYRFFRNPRSWSVKSISTTEQFMQHPLMNRYKNKSFYQMNQEVVR